MSSEPDIITEPTAVEPDEGGFPEIGPETFTEAAITNQSSSNTKSPSPPPPELKSPAEVRLKQKRFRRLVLQNGHLG